jgi:transcriptional regulator with XRE-family HTH domain
MSTERWCEWCHLRKEYLELTNAEIADAAGVSEVSVARIMSGHVKDIRVTTMQAVTKVLVNGTWGQYPCALGAENIEDRAELLEKCARLEKTVSESHESEQKKIDYLRQQIKFQEDQIIAKDKLIEENYQLVKQRNKTAVILSILLGLAVVVLITALAIDASHSGVGFFWTNALQ